MNSTICRGRKNWWYLLTTDSEPATLGGQFTVIRCCSSSDSIFFLVLMWVLLRGRSQQQKWDQSNTIRSIPVFLDKRIGTRRYSNEGWQLTSWQPERYIGRRCGSTSMLLQQRRIITHCSWSLISSGVLSRALFILLTEKSVSVLADA